MDYFDFIKSIYKSSLIATDPFPVDRNANLVCEKLINLKQEIDSALMNHQPRKFKKLTTEYIRLKSEYAITK